MTFVTGFKGTTVTNVTYVTVLNVSPVASNHFLQLYTSRAGSVTKINTSYQHSRIITALTKIQLVHQYYHINYNIKLVHLKLPY